MPPRTIPSPRTLLTALALVLALTAAARAQRRRPASGPDPEPEVLRTPQGLTEVGTLAEVPYRIDVPANWNHSLVVFFHGYAEGPYTYHLGALLSDQVVPIFDRGYAIIQSGYSTPGWAIAEAYPETEQLRQYFLRRYAQPALGRQAKKPGNLETFAAGASMGGLLVTATLELNPKPYAGGLDLCGSVGPSDIALQRRFAWRAAFDVFFPGLLPPLDPVPADFQESRTLRLRVEDALKSRPAASQALRDLTGLHSDHDLAVDMVYFTFVLGEMQRRARGNPFDNRNFIYAGTDPVSSATDNLLNDQVRRYAAFPPARDYLLHHYTPTGRLTRPMLALHTTYDPRVPAENLRLYAEQVALAGASDNLVQQYVHRDGHCAFTEQEIGEAFDELTNWAHTNHRPQPGQLPPVLHPQVPSTASR